MLGQNTINAEINEELVEKYQKGSINVDVFYKLFKKSNSGLINKIVHKYYSKIHSNPKYSCIDKNDIQSEAELAVINAAGRYDFNSSRFSTFAVQHMKWAIINFLNRKINKNFIYENEDNKSEDNIKNLYNVISLSSEYGEGLTYEDMIADENVNVFEDVDKSVNEKMFKEALKNLSDKEKLIIKKLFGLGCAEVTGEELGKELGISRQGVKYFKDKALQNIRAKMNHNYSVALQS